MDVKIEFTLGQKLSDKQAFSLALQQAEKALGHCSPNPPVGCVILDADNTLLSMGHTQRPGSAHAEIHAIENLKVKKQGLKFFVTLEPCCHQGRTGPCTQALIELGASEVTYGEKDPNPAVDGKGLKELENAGVKVSRAEGFAEQLDRLTEIFKFNVANKSPFVSLKMATTLDGQIGMKSGESKWITSEEARKHGHHMRSKHDAILVGVNTFLADDPSLNVRFGPFAGKEMKVVILDPRGRCFAKLKGSQLLKAHRPENIWVFSNAEQMREEHGVRSFALAPHGPDKLFDLKDVLGRLYREGVSSVFVEGGARTASEFLNQKVVHRVYQYIAPAYIGGRSGALATEAVKVEKLSEKLTLQDPQVKTLNPDILVTGRLG